MLHYHKKCDSLVCIDSDGTIMDTMTIKHIRSFGPEFLIAFEIHEHKQEILNEWNRVNLYSKSRGINRFQGLKVILEFVQEKYGYSFAGFSFFEDWVLNTNSLSNESLDEAINHAPEKTCMLLAKKWSVLVNQSIDQLPKTEAFSGVKEILYDIQNMVDLLGVSSANKEAVLEEWTRLGFYEYFREVACQDVGTKKDIIAQALQKGYLPSRALMIGDALGDYRAAKENHIWFYPILPGKEIESWKRFKEETIGRLTSGQFDASYQQQLLDEFDACLQ